MISERQQTRRKAGEDGPDRPPEHAEAVWHDQEQEVLDVLAEAGGPVRVEDLARAVTAGGTTQEAATVEEVERRLLARVLPTLLDERAVEFSPERCTVSLAAADSTPGRSLRFLGLGSAGVATAVAIAAPGIGWTMLAVGSVAGVFLLSLATLAGRRSLRPDRSSSPVRSFHPVGLADPASVDVADRDPDRRILGLLLASGGRLHQQAIVDRLDLSESTVSRHLSSLAEAGHLAKLPVGRENLVCLPRARPTGVASGGSRPPDSTTETGD